MRILRSRRSRRQKHVLKGRDPLRPSFQVISIAGTVFCIVLLSILVRGRVLPTHQNDLFLLTHHEHPSLPRRGVPVAEAALLDINTKGTSANSNRLDRRNRISQLSTKSDLVRQRKGALADKDGLGEPLNGTAVVHTMDNLSQKQQDVVSADGSIFSVQSDAFSIHDTGRVVDISATSAFQQDAPEAALAFFIQVSAANLGFLPRLLVVLWHPKNVYVLHLDKKIDKVQIQQVRETVRGNDKFRNVHILPSEPITYKGVSMLLNTLSAIEFLLDVEQQWDYFINLSGCDYPLVNIENMRRILGQESILSKKLTFLQLAPDKKFWKRMKESRFNYVYYDTALRMNEDEPDELLNTWMPHPVANSLGIDFVQAEAWIIAHRSFAQYATRSSFARKLLLLLSTMQDPEEHFFAMLAWNTEHLNSTLAHHAFRGIYWQLNGKKAGQHPYYVDMQDSEGRYPFWQDRIAKSKCFFARKFRDPHSALLDRIDRQMSGNHKQADQEEVIKSAGKVKLFVKCVSEVQRIADKIHGHLPCWASAEWDLALVSDRSEANER